MCPARFALFCRRLPVLSLALSLGACPGPRADDATTGPPAAPSPAPGYRAVARPDHGFWMQVPVDWVRLSRDVPSVVEVWGSPTRDATVSVILVSSEDAGILVDTGLAARCADILRDLRAADPATRAGSVQRVTANERFGACTFLLDVTSAARGPRAVVHHMVFSSAGTFSVVIDADRGHWSALRETAARVVAGFVPLARH